MAVQLASVKPDIDLSKLPKVTETYEVQWAIPEWRKVRKHHILVNSQKIIFETGGGSSFPHGCRSKWAVGLDVKSSVYGGPDKAGVQWNLMDFEEASADQIFEVSARNQLLGQTGEFFYTEEMKEDCMYEGQMFNGNGNFVEVVSKQRRTLGHTADYIQEDGSLKYQLTLVLKSRLKDKNYVDYKVEQFLKTSNKQMCENRASLLNRRDANSDLKIVTGDGKEIFVHGAILQAQCPVFAWKLNRDHTETNTGVVKVNVSASTMDILLKYVYTGELLPSWREDEKIVEFTYAAGKYRIFRILKLLDDVLGTSIPHGEASHVDVQLLNLASKWSMPKAEKRLLKRIVDKINSVKGSQEIFDLFGYHKHEVLKMAELLGGEMFEDTKVLEILDDLIGNTEGNKEEFEERGLHLLAVIQIKNGNLNDLETSLLKRFRKSIREISSADQLFAVFGQGKRKR